jgi:DNA invertase Pin-like site-specific DNA recombinase
MSNKIQPIHLERRAVVYLRQSSLQQVREHRESTTRQYALQQRAIELGWSSGDVEVIDDDLGQSGTTAEGRVGFARLAEDVARGQVGAIFALEVSRLARCSADWHRLLDLCGLADVVIVDEQVVYNPSDYNDRLLLGVKGTMSEAEQYWMRLRLQGGMLSKARRGEMHMRPPTGYEWDDVALSYRITSDESVHRAIALVFERFRLDATAGAVVRYFESKQLRLPTYGMQNKLRWIPPTRSAVLNMLHNPTYAGAYVYGRRCSRRALVNGTIKKRHRTNLLPEDWKVCLRGRHPAYISWDEFMDNQKRLDANRNGKTNANQRGAPRDGEALLHGLVLCGVCGRRMYTRYTGKSARPMYFCNDNQQGGSAGGRWWVSAPAIDDAVAELFLAVVQPPDLELGLAVAGEAERQAGEVDRQWKLRLDQLRYESCLAERRYKAVDPDNRVVARTLEREWNDKLSELEALEREHQEVRRREKVELSDADRKQILALARDLHRVWNARTTSAADRKNLVRMLIEKITLTPIDVPSRMSRVQVLWKTGAVDELQVGRRSVRDPEWPEGPPPQLIELIRDRFRAGDGDAAIAAQLNARGFRTRRDRAWSVHSVVTERHRLRLLRPFHKPTPERRADGLYSVRGVAARMGVTEGIVCRWIQMGWLVPVVRGRPRWFKLDDATLERLHAAKARGYGPGARPRRNQKKLAKDKEEHCA